MSYVEPSEEALAEALATFAGSSVRSFHVRLCALALDRFRAAGVREKEREIEQLTNANKLLREMADAAEQWYRANNRAYLDTLGSKERVFDALCLLGRYPPSKDIVEPLPMLEGGDDDGQ